MQWNGTSEVPGDLRPCACAGSGDPRSAQCLAHDGEQQRVGKVGDNKSSELRLAFGVTPSLTLPHQGAGDFRILPRQGEEDFASVPRQRGRGSF